MWWARGEEETMRFSEYQRNTIKKHRRRSWKFAQTAQRNRDDYQPICCAMIVRRNRMMRVNLEGLSPANWGYNYHLIRVPHYPERRRNNEA